MLYCTFGVGKSQAVTKANKFPGDAYVVDEGAIFTVQIFWQKRMIRATDKASMLPTDLQIGQQYGVAPRPADRERR